MSAHAAKGLTITNPLVLYRSLLATNRIQPDPGQHRLAIHLQKLYEQLKDYEPTIDYRQRLNQISRAVGPHDAAAIRDDLPIPERRRSMLSSILRRNEEKDSLALARVLSSHEAALQMTSPKGLMVHGEVGTGKSMLIDLFADCLPNRKKRRWHFSTFMLETISKLERLRQSRLTASASSGAQQDEYSLLWLARDMIETSPILFLDEFQLPDRAASKIMSNLMTSFFQLGGVLIATSNRMPEELAKAAGIQFAAPPSRIDSIRWSLGLGGKSSLGGRTHGSFEGQNEFGAFLEVLKARCEVWEMEGRTDYRRRDSVSSVAHSGVGVTEKAIDGMSSESGPDAASYGLASNDSPTEDALIEAGEVAVGHPAFYFVKPPATGPIESLQTWLADTEKTQLEVAGLSNDSLIPWTPGVMRVYGRNVIVPKQYQGISSWTFEQLCTRTLGPADYITLASTFHTIILTDVPVLTLMEKNEARRFITLLDALYEARCKLLITAAAGPDDIFFPERKGTKTDGSPEDGQDAVYPETFAEIYQDVTAPFRPNIAMYGEEARSEPDYTHARLQGILADDALEDDPPNRIRRMGTFNDGDLPDAKGGGRPLPNFSQIGAYTGEDERFAYKRARSRLWEMCGARWWARNEEGWWRPLSSEVRHWEKPAGSPAPIAAVQVIVEGKRYGEGAQQSRDINEKEDQVMFKHGASPFRQHNEPPPKISWTHVWGTMKWGKRAGAWGQGVEGLNQRDRTKDRDKGE